jgi:hypothetical protein
LAFSWTDKPWFLTEGKLLLYSSYLPLGVPNWTVIHINRTATSNNFMAPLPGKRKTSAKGEFRTHILYFVLSFALLYFYLHHFIKNTKKLVSFIVVICLLLVHYVVP